MRKLHILLIEDNEGDIVLTIDAFVDNKIFADISVVKNGHEALNFLYNEEEFENVKKPDLILLDINIPILNGHEVLKEIKENPKLKKIPVIILTTSDNQKDKNKAYENYANSFITKPLNMDALLKAVVKFEGFWIQLSTAVE